MSKRKSACFFVFIAVCVLMAIPALAYEKWWWIDGDGNWFYSMEDGSIAKDTWIHDRDDGEWYLLGEDGRMRTGLYESNGRYYLLDMLRGTGTYGKLLKDGNTYQGVRIVADTSGEYEGALSQDTIAALERTGLDISTAVSVSGTPQVENGQEKGTGTTEDAAITAPTGWYEVSYGIRDHSRKGYIHVSGNTLSIAGYVQFSEDDTWKNRQDLGYRTMELALTDQTKYVSEYDEMDETPIYCTKDMYFSLVHAVDGTVVILELENGVVKEASQVQ